MLGGGLELSVGGTDGGYRPKKLRLATSIRWGVVCGACKGGCQQIATEDQPLRQQCHVCNGDDEHCETCGGNDRGIAVTSCPKQLVPGEIWRLLRLYDFVESGAWPVGGGTLDQTDGFLDLVRFVQSEESEIKTSLRVQTGQRDAE